MYDAILETAAKRLNYLPPVGATFTFYRRKKIDHILTTVRFVSFHFRSKNNTRERKHTENTGYKNIEKKKKKKKFLE